MNLRLARETPRTLVYEWDAVQGATGYRFTRSDQEKRPHTWEGDRTTVTFSKPATDDPVIYRVEALSVLEVAETTYPLPPAPPTPPSPPSPPSSQGMPDRTVETWRASGRGAQAEQVSLAAFTGPRPGKFLKVNGTGQLSSSQVSALTKARPNVMSWVEFGPGVTVRTGMEWRVSNLSVWGLDVSNPAGFGSRPSASRDFTWWGARIHDCGATGLLVHSNVDTNERLDLAAEIWNCGLDLRHDPHAEPGTGLHTSYIGSGDSGSTTADSKFALWLHDQTRGAAVQIGNRLDNSQLWVDARRISFVAQRQVGGNALQWWGSTRDNTVHYVYGEDLAGRLSETNGGPGTGNRILVGRYRNVRLSPVCAKGVPWDDLKAI